MKPNYKPILQGESNLFNVILQANKKEFEYSWHYHKECELVYILNGYGHRYVGNSIDVFSNNDLVLLGSNLPHCWINEVESKNQSPSAVVIYLKEEFFTQPWFESCEFGSIRGLLELASKGIKFNPKVAMRLKGKCIELLKLPPMKRFIFLMEILQDLSETPEVNYELLSEQDLSAELNPVNNARINVIYQYVEKNYQKKITLAGVAKEVYMSPGYFSRFFSRMMKKSFFEFLNEYKVSVSCKLLIETNKSISEVCYESGFESIPFFYRQFKKFKKYQPNQYRLNYKKASS
jgi:AraC-like DNA-binding protein